MSKRVSSIRAVLPWPGCDAKYPPDRGFVSPIRNIISDSHTVTNNGLMMLEDGTSGYLAILLTVLAQCYNGNLPR